MKNLYVDKIKPGMKVEDIFMLKNIKDEWFLMDKKGTIKTVKSDLVKEELKDGIVVKVTGVAIAIKNELTVKLSAFTVAEEGTYNITDFCSAITEEKKEEYKTGIRALMKNIKHVGYRTLVENCLTEDVLERLGTITIPGEVWGCYQGAPLASTCIVPYMACGSSNSFEKRGNGISHKPIDQDMLLTAALLHEFARGVYVDETDPERKSLIGVTMHYFSLLVVKLQERRVGLEEILSELDFAKLINCLEVSVTRSATCSVSREGMFLRSIISVYHEVDAYDWQVLLKPEEEGREYYYSTRIGCYVVNSSSSGGDMNDGN